MLVVNDIPPSIIMTDFRVLVPGAGGIPFSDQRRGIGVPSARTLSGDGYSIGVGELVNERRSFDGDKACRDQLPLALHAGKLGEWYIRVV